MSDSPEPRTAEPQSGGVSVAPGAERRRSDKPGVPVAKPQKSDGEPIVEATVHRAAHDCRTVLDEFLVSDVTALTDVFVPAAEVIPLYPPSKGEFLRARKAGKF